MNRKLAVVGAIAVLIIVIIAFAALKKPGAKAPEEQAAANLPASVNGGWTKASVKPSLEVDAPQTAGDAVTVAKVDAPLPAFVVIRDASSNKIIGASSVIAPPGSTNVKINAAVSAGKTYTAELQVDGDNNGSFDPANDPPFLVSGKAVAVTFKVK